MPTWQVYNQSSVEGCGHMAVLLPDKCMYLQSHAPVGHPIPDTCINCVPKLSPAPWRWRMEVGGTCPALWGVTVGAWLLWGHEPRYFVDSILCQKSQPICLAVCLQKQQIPTVPSLGSRHSIEAHPSSALCSRPEGKWKYERNMEKGNSRRVQRKKRSQIFGRDEYFSTQNSSSCVLRVQIFRCIVCLQLWRMLLRNSSNIKCVLKWRDQRRYSAGTKQPS